MRVVEPRVHWRGAIGTLAITATAGALVLILWRLWRADQHEAAPVRRLADVELDWKCEAGHAFKAPGRAGAKSCPTCQKPAFAVVRYGCELHGAVEVFARFGGNPSEPEKLSHLKLAGRDWTPADRPLICPRCTRELRRPRPETKVGGKTRDKAIGG